MAEINDLSATDASNTARMPENMAPSAVNNGVRALEGILARWHKDNNGSLVSTGSANAYVLAANQTLSAYYDGLTLVFETNFANTAAATLNADANGAQALVWSDGKAVASGDIPAGVKITVRYDLDNTRWLIVAGLIRGPLIASEVATTSGTSVTLTTASPAWAKRITLMPEGMSTNGVSPIIMRIGPTAGVEATGYLGGAGDLANASQATSAISTGFVLVAIPSAAATYHGVVELVLKDATNNTWSFFAIIFDSTGAVVSMGAGVKSLAGVLTDIALTTFGGVNTFDAGDVGRQTQ